MTDEAAYFDNPIALDAANGFISYRDTTMRLRTAR